ncbi:mycothiol synthase [Frondihabitans cladoniiphilus]|uniref:Mycothiol acetyltransferase n=1 Tax=Frondihabitans cladoniiphilus TaxID=715785 RepID=A0ABP8VX16_9MICO
MSQPSRPDPSTPAELPATEPATTAGLAALAAEALRVDGTPPFSDQALVEARSGEARVVGDMDALAIVRPGEAELVVRPEMRRRGLGTRILRSVVDSTTGDLAVWAHGDHPGAARLAAEFGFAPVRRLLQQRAAIARDAPAPALPEGAVLRSFRPGADDSAWLDLNARAFADHAEQGSLGQRDLDARKADDWFDADDFLLLWKSDEPGAALLAFCWLKVVEGEPGEFYAVGVAPEHQGEHLGGVVVDAGLARLAARGLTTAALYVEGDNAAALRLYAARGFTDHAVDVQYLISRSLG